MASRPLMLLFSGASVASVAHMGLDRPVCAGRKGQVLSSGGWEVLLNYDRWKVH